MIPLTPQLEQALTMICDAALKHGGVQMFGPVSLIQNLAELAKREQQAKPEAQINGEAHPQ